MPDDDDYIDGYMSHWLSVAIGELDVVISLHAVRRRMPFSFRITGARGGSAPLFLQQAP